MKYCEIFIFLLLMIMDASTNAQEVTCEGEQLINVDILIGHPGINSPYKPGHVLVFRCTDVNLKMYGQRAIECLSNGKWDHPYPRCEEVTCELKSTTFEIKNNTEGKTIFRPGESVEITCSKKSWLFFTQTTSRSFTCKDNGEWNYIPGCEEIRCEFPRDQHVYRPCDYFRGDMKLGAKQNYYCMSGYDKMAEEATCTEDGWTPKPLCAILRKCGPPPHVNDSDTKDMTKKEYRTGERVEYMCFSKYTLDEHPPFSKYLTCQQGQWSGNIKCLKPCTVTKEIMDKRGIELAYADQQKMFTPHNDHITFKCQRGKYTRSTDFRQQCNDGEMTLPQCV
ncbi:complement factor H-related protein 2-like isoform X2 [Labeo rohita]|uniref:complement factor H-related protein 2-like isoform X2 n=1 Tax=Labeo rohita TaxID=84645 RepID=UPI0021E1D8F2|nr:complement factor H-related protein 2-like isoform X2 [Labeo rohita]